MQDLLVRETEAPAVPATRILDIQSPAVTSDSRTLVPITNDSVKYTAEFAYGN